MPCHASPLECSAESRAELIAISRSRSGEVRMVERARIVLACLEGKEIQQVAQLIGASVPTVSKWRSRFAHDGMRGLRDRARSGKPPTYDAAFRDHVLALRGQGQTTPSKTSSNCLKPPEFVEVFFSMNETVRFQDGFSVLELRPEGVSATQHRDFLGVVIRNLVNEKQEGIDSRLVRQFANPPFGSLDHYLVTEVPFTRTVTI